MTSTITPELLERLAITYALLFSLYLGLSFAHAVSCLLPKASLPLALRNSSWALTCICGIWFWQYYMRTDWRPWGILSISAVNLGVIAAEYLSLKWHSPRPEQMTLPLIIIGLGATLQVLQAGLVISLSGFPDKSYEPLIRDTTVISCWRRRSLQAPKLGATCGQPPNHSTDPSQLDSLYQAHERIFKERADKFPRNFITASHLFWEEKASHHAGINSIGT